MVLTRPITQIVPLVFICLVPAVAEAAGWFYFDPIGIEAEIRFDGNLQKNNGVEESRSFLLEERVLLNQSGYIWSPKISNFSFEVIPIFRQERRVQLEEKDSGRGNDLNYGFTIDFLREASGAIDAVITSSRSTNINDAAFATRNKTDVSAHEVLFNWKNTYLPVRFIFSKGSYSQIFDETTGASRAWRDEDRKRYEIAANNSKMQLMLRKESVDENVSGNDYEDKRGRLSHLFQWGKGSALRSLVDAQHRTGFNSFKRFNWQEIATIQHTADVFSQSEYIFDRQESFAEEGFNPILSSEHRARFRLEHNLYDNLFTSGKLSARLRDSDQVDQTDYVAGGAANYSKTFFSQLNVNLSLRGEFGKTDRVTRDGPATVLNERHIASFTDRIILGRPLVYEPTIRVTADDGFTYLEEFDYEVLPLGELYTELRIIPSGRIEIGDLLLVSYQYDPFPSANYNTLSGGYGFALRYKWASVYYNTGRSDHHLNSGSITPADRRDETAGLELNFKRDQWDARFQSEHRYRRIGGFESDTLLFSQFFGMKISDTLNISFSANQVFNDSVGVVFPDPRLDDTAQINDLSTDHYAVDAFLYWYPRPSLRISPRLGYWSRKEEIRSGNIRETDRQYLTAELRVSWFLRRLMMEFWYKRNTIDTGFSNVEVEDTTRVDNRLMVSIRRSFR